MVVGVRRPLAAVMAVGALVAVSACAGAPAGVSVPAWPNPPPAPHYAGSQCKTIDVIGDSLSAQIGNDLQVALQQTGRCATVINDGHPGSSPTDWVSWLPGRLAAHPETDFVVAYFLGLGGFSGPAIGDPHWFTASQQAATQLAADATAAGKKIYWVVPAPSYAFCFPPGVAYLSSLWQQWAHWQASALSPTVDARTPFGGDIYQQTFRFPNGTIADVRQATINFAGGVYADCAHFTELGATLAAQVVATGIAAEWQ